jgi:hypothetical protein
MAWNPEAVARERPLLQAFADYKYDEYEQYRPGMRFIESLARWLVQFPEIEQRHCAYQFVRDRLIYVSRAELHHLVATVFPDIVRPILIARAARDCGLEAHRVAEVLRTRALDVRGRSCLYVGLSDGARTDVLRRSAPTINNEQVVTDYQALSVKADELLTDLRSDLKPKLGSSADEARFTTLVLLDDFSASGISYLRDEDGVGKGKVAKLAAELDKAPQLLSKDDLEVHIVLYVATDRAIAHLTERLPSLESTLSGTWTIHRGLALPDEVIVSRGDLADLDGLIDACYDPAINDRHMKKGGTDGRYGFADCGLPVILSHNTPNNSLALLWWDEGSTKALFPRVRRHREDQ